MNPFMSCRAAHAQTKRVIGEKHETLIKTLALQIQKAVARGDFSLCVSATDFPSGVKEILIEEGYRISCLDSEEKADKLVKISWAVPASSRIDS